MHSGDTLKIRISGLSDGVHEYHFDADPTELGLGEEFQDSISVGARLEKSNRQLYLTVSISTAARFQCDRCVEEFSRSLSTSYHMFYVYDQLETGRFEEDEVQVISKDDTHIEIGDDVRQILLLAVPFKLLCRDDCKGLCPRCGTNLNESSCDCATEEADPRWEGLRKLKNN